MTQQRTTLTSKQVVAQIKIIMGAMLAGMLAFTGTILFLVLAPGFDGSPDLVPIFSAVLAAMGIAFVGAVTLAGRVLAARSSAPTLDSAATDQQRLKSYMGVKLLRVALTEAFGLSGTVFLLITGSLYFLAAPIVSIWIMTRLFPRASEMEAFSPSIGPGASTHGGAIEP